MGGSGRPRTSVARCSVAACRCAKWMRGRGRARGAGRVNSRPNVATARSGRGAGAVHLSGAHARITTFSVFIVFCPALRCVPYRDHSPFCPTLRGVSSMRYVSRWSDSSG